ncbi:GTPase RsgA, partial [Streptococcus danieliae]|nr:GTPase RsgA [Streptococcus danieliae]
DYNIIVTSMREPDFSAKLLDKLIALNESSKINSIILFTKIDILDDKDKYVNIKEYYSSLGYKTFDNSEFEVAKLRKFISGKFVVISGQSGAG